MSEFAGRRVLVLMGNRDASVYGYQALAICRALGRVGASAVHMETPHVSEVTRKLPPERILEAIQTHGCTDALAVNIPPALAIPGVVAGDGSIPPGFRWHTWVQDLYDAHSDLPKMSFETRWNWVRRWGGNVLQPATDYGRFHQESDGYDYDVSFIGYLPTQQMSFSFTDPRITMDANCILAEIHKMIGAAPDGCHYRTDPESLGSLWRLGETMAGRQVPENALQGCLHYLAVNGVRFIQRLILMRRVVAVCQARGWRLGISGMEWDRVPDFAPHAIGHCLSGEMAAHLARRSKINLHCNGEVLFHNRLLENFAAGGFTLSWCPGDTDDEGLGVPKFNMGNLEERLDYWVKRQEERMEVVGRIGDEVREFFTFEEMVTRMLRGASGASDEAR